MIKKRFLGVTMLVMSTICLMGGSVSAEGEPTVNYAPPQETLINGIEESKIIRPHIIGYDNPIFVSYTPSAGASEITKFKYIAGISADNSRSSAPFPIKLILSQTSSSGSEFSGSVEFKASVKAGIIGKLDTTVAGGVKETRTTNEGVGWEFGPLSIPAGKSGGIDSWWKGKYSYGSLGVKYVDTGSKTGYTPTMYSQVNVKVHSKESKKIHGESWTK